MQSKRINQLEKGERIESFYLIKDVSCKLTNSGNNKFLDFDLIDKTGIINAKMWEFKNDEEKKLKNNMLVKIKGNVLEWRGKLQIKIDTIREVNKEDNINIEEFVPVAPYKADKMYDEVLNYTLNIKNDDIRNIVIEILNEYEQRLMYYPAAKSNHHALRSGLLYHTTSMLKSGEKLCEIYDYINTDLLYAGIILHDIAKIEEMDSSELGIVSQYTIEGQLLGHIIMGVKKIEVIGEKVKADKEVIMLLQHMVLSHHYEAEYGSPKKPMIPEAEMLHYLDILDARMYDMKKAVNEVKEGEFSDKIWSLDNLRVYRSKLSK